MNEQTKKNKGSWSLYLMLKAQQGKDTDNLLNLKPAKLTSRKEFLLPLWP